MLPGSAQRWLRPGLLTARPDSSRPGSARRWLRPALLTAAAGTAALTLLQLVTWPQPAARDCRPLTSSDQQHAAVEASETDGDRTDDPKQPPLLPSAAPWRESLWRRGESRSGDVERVALETWRESLRRRGESRSGDGAAAEGVPPVRALLLTYMRSGSTFTGELLTLRPDFNYLFEPLWRFNGVHVPGYSAAEMSDSRARHLAALFRCDPLITREVLREAFVKRVRFLLADCRRRPLLAKVIRADGETLSRLLEMHPTLKVIHLVRDPRAAVSSRAHVGANASGALYCQEIRDHLAVTSRLAAGAADRYTLVRYEDLANQHTLSSELGRLYRFMGVALPEEALRYYIRSHYQASGGHSLGGQEPPPVHTDSYGTRRQADFNPNRWRERLDGEQRRQIETECRDVMERFGYTS